MNYNHWDFDIREDELEFVAHYKAWKCQDGRFSVWLKEKVYAPRMA